MIKRPFSVIVIPTVPVIINKIIKYSVLINTGAELNMITADVTDKTGLTIKTRVKIKILLYSEHINRFLEMIENMLISIGLIFCRVNIFVIRLVS